MSSVEPLMSANSAVTVLRSPSRVSGAGAPVTRMGESADLLADATVAAVPRAAPHSPQKRLPAGLSARHFGQRFASGAPQSPQNFLLEGFSAPHFEQRTLYPSASPLHYGMLNHRSETKDGIVGPESSSFVGMQRCVSQDAPVASHRETAIDLDYRARDVGSRIRKQKPDRRRYVFDLAEARQRDPLERPRPILFRQDRRHVGFDKSQGYGIDPHAERTELFRHRFGHPDQPGL